MNDNIANFLAALIGGIFLVGVICLLLGLPVWILWNLLIPSIFGLPSIGFWEAVGLNLLCSFLFKSTSTNTSKSK
jgi:hypothetical protein